MKKILITGGTGSGKTYKAFELAKEIGSFAYFSPTKLLAYESFIEYGSDNSRINTSSVKFGDGQNYFGCYASVGQWYSTPKLPADLPADLYYRNQPAPPEMRPSVLEDLFFIKVGRILEDRMHSHFWSCNEPHRWSETVEIAEKFLGIYDFIGAIPCPDPQGESDSYSQAWRARNPALIDGFEFNCMVLYKALCEKIDTFFAYKAQLAKTHSEELVTALESFAGEFGRYCIEICPRYIRRKIANRGGGHGYHYELSMEYLSDVRQAIDALQSETPRAIEKNPTSGQAPFDTIIIDEAHWASNNDNHSYYIKRMVKEFKGNIILVTAEDINTPEGFETIKLENFSVDATIHHDIYIDGNSSNDDNEDEDDDYYDSNDDDDYYQQNEKVTEWKERTLAGVPSLAICSSRYEAIATSEYLDEHGIKHHLVYRGCSEKHIIESFFDFKYNGGVLVSTNMAQQGINLPCNNLYLTVNDYDNNQGLSQKLGRLSRRGYQGNHENTVFVDVENIYNNQYTAEKVKYNFYDELDVTKTMLKRGCVIDWNNFSFDENDQPPYEPRDSEAEEYLKELIIKFKERNG